MPAISTTTALAVAGIGAGASVAGGLIARSGAGAQARAAENATAMGVAEQRRQFDLSRQDLLPWKQAGGLALERLQHLLGLGSPTGPNGLRTGSPSAVRPTVAPGSDGGGLPPGYREYDGGMVPERNPGETVNSYASRVAGGGGVRPLSAVRMLPGADPDAWEGDPRAWLNPVYTEDGGEVLPPGGGAPRPGGAYNPGEFGSLDRDFNLQDFEKDPGYEFRLTEGTKALERSAAARGGLVSGRTGKELTRFGQDYASDEYGKAFNRFEANRAGRYNRYASLAGVGQTTATQLADIGSRTAGNIAGLQYQGMTDAAAARAAGNAALGQGIGGAANQFSNWYLLSRMFRKQGGGGITDPFAPI